MTEAEWVAIFTMAGAKAPAVPGPSVHGLVGRSIAKAAQLTCFIWGRYQARLIPYMTQAAIAALDALVVALPVILNLNPPGPQ